jgi:microcystin degradation protein MlrC
MLVRAIRGLYRPVHATLRVPIISPTVLQWTGASPWMDLVQRALTWEAREPDVYVNFYFGFPFADVPDVGMTFQVMTDGDPGLARRRRRHGSGSWRQRKALIGSTKSTRSPKVSRSPSRRWRATRRR